MAQHDDRIRAGRTIFLHREEATERGTRLEHGEKVAARGAHLNRLATIRAGEAHRVGVEAERGQPRERPSRGAVVDEVRVGEVVEASTILRAAEGDNPFGMPHSRWGSKQKRIGERHDRRRCADANGDREHRDDRKQGTSAEGPDGVADVLSQEVEHGRASDGVEGSRSYGTKARCVSMAAKRDRGSFRN